MGKLISLALVAKGGRFDTRMIYAGWTEEGFPVLTANENDLSEDAVSQMQTFVRSGYPIPILPMKRQLSVVVVEFAGPVQDLKDPSPSNIVQDTIKINVHDSHGNSMELTLGELEVLDMIGNNLIIFQRVGSILDTQERQEAVSYFSFFLPGSSESGVDRQDLLVLIRPTNENVGNLIDTIIFMQDVIRKLLTNDENQPKQYKKGYLSAGLEAEAEITKEMRKAYGFFGFLKDPVTASEPNNSLKQMIMDFVSVPADGSKPNNILRSSETKILDTNPDRSTLDRMKLTAVKMYLFARSRVRNSR